MTGLVVLSTNANPLNKLITHSKVLASTTEWHRRDLNLRPTDPETDTLTTQAPRRADEIVAYMPTPKCGLALCDIKLQHNRLWPEFLTVQ